MDIQFWREFLIGLIGPAIGGFVAVVGAIYIERRRDLSRRRQRHLELLKKEVLERVSSKLKDWYIPILKKEKSSIHEQWIKQPLQGISITERERQGSFELVFAQYGEPSPDQHLYECSKAIHFPEFFNRLEAWQHDFDSFNQECVCYVKELVTRIEQGMPIPVHTMAEEQTKWIGSKRLAIYVFEMQFGFPFQVVRLECRSQNLWDIELPGGYIALHGVSTEEKDACLKLVEDLMHDRATADNLIKSAKQLEKEATSLMGDLEILLRASHLHSDCDEIRT